MHPLLVIGYWIGFALNLPLLTALALCDESKEGGWKKPSELDGVDVATGTFFILILAAVWPIIDAVGVLLVVLALIGAGIKRLAKVVGM